MALIRAFRLSRRDRPTVDRSSDPPRVRPRARVSVVIPALNEARNLPLVLPHIPRDVYEVILVDGCSTDDTVSVAQTILPTVRIVVEAERGKGAALCAGFRAAEGEIIVMLDADGSTDPNEIPRFVDALLRGADFAKGSRFLSDGGSTDISRLRAFGNWGFVLLVRLLFGGRYTDLCYGYNAFWASVLPALALDGTGFEIETMMNIRALREGLIVAEVPSFERSRIHGVSNLRTFRDGARVLRTILRERVSRGDTPTRRHGLWDPIRPTFSGRGEVATSHLVPVMDAAQDAQLELAFESQGARQPDVGPSVLTASAEHGRGLVPVIDRSVEPQTVVIPAQSPMVAVLRSAPLLFASDDPASDPDDPDATLAYAAAEN